MNRQKQEYEQTHGHNGVGHENATSSSSAMGLSHSEVQGFLTVGAGIILLLAPWAFPTLLNMAVVATAAALLFFGGRKAHLVSRTRELIQRWRQK